MKRAMVLRRVSILGSTGSVGKKAVDLLRQQETFGVEVLVANQSVELLAQQARDLRCRHVVIANPAFYRPLKEALSGTDTKISAGEEAVLEAAACPVDWTLSAMVGSCALKPTLCALEHSRVVALANKESLVVGGHLIKEAVERFGATLIPVDSEHNALFQLLNGVPKGGPLQKMILTASGGPFRTYSAADLVHVTREKALKHPNWSMGAKISIDSATLMNKGLELIEACCLFDVLEEQVDIWVHPESIVHALIGFEDGSMLSSLSVPDMTVPLAFALAWPERLQTRVPSLDLTALGRLTFEPLDEKKFPAPGLCREAYKAQGGRPIQLNASNEVAVEAFLQNQLSFCGITALVQEVLSCLPSREEKDLESLLAIDQEARVKAREIVLNKLAA